MPRTWPPDSTPWAITASAPASTAARASLTEPTVWIHGFAVRRRGRAAQWVTTTSASAAASQCPRRASGTIRFTASGLPVSLRAAAISPRSVSRVEDPDRAERSGVGDRRGELVRREAAAHPGLDDGDVDAEGLERVRHYAAGFSITVARP